MKRIKVVAHAQYDLSDLQKIHVNPTVLSRLVQHGINLEVKPNEDGINRVLETDLFDVLIVDDHSWKSSQDIVALCRETHPKTRVVMFGDLSHYTTQEKSKYDACYPLDYLGRANPDGIVVSILKQLGLWTDAELHKYWGSR